MLSYAVFLCLCLGTGAQTAASTYIHSFIQSPAGVVAADTDVVFSCEAVSVIAVYWLIEGVRYNDSTSTPQFRIMTQQSNGGSTLSTLSTRAKGNENNTQVICVATAFGSVNESRTSHIVVAAPPLPPFLQLTLFPNASHLQATWNRPFTMSGFPITSYTLDVVNKTNGQRTKVILDQNLTERVIYNLSSPGLPLSCQPLSFSAIASNAVGDSGTSNIVTAGFSIFPRTDNVTLHVDLDTTSSLPQLILTFQAPEVCTFQDPATYTVGIFDARGDEILVTDARTINTSVVVEVIEARLERGNSYSAELTIQHHNVPGEVFITFIGIDFGSSVSTTTKGNGSARDCLSVPVVWTSMIVLVITANL